MLEIIFSFWYCVTPKLLDQKRWEVNSGVMSNRKERVHMCKISQLITGCSDSWHTSLHLPVYHGMLFFPPSPLPGFPAYKPRQGQLKEMIAPQDLWEIHSRLPPCLQNTLTPTKEQLPSPVVLQSSSPSIECHREQEPSSLSPVTGANWEPNTGCIQFKPQSFSLAFCYRIGIDNLDTETEIIRWLVIIQNCDNIYCEAWGKKRKSDQFAAYIKCYLMQLWEALNCQLKMLTSLVSRALLSSDYYYQGTKCDLDFTLYIMLYFHIG